MTRTGKHSTHIMRKTLAEAGREKACVKCAATKDLAVHHIIAFQDGGDATADNLDYLCAFCHAEWHWIEQVSSIPYHSWVRLASARDAVLLMFVMLEDEETSGGLESTIDSQYHEEIQKVRHTVNMFQRYCIRLILSRRAEEQEVCGDTAPLPPPFAGRLDFGPAGAE